MSKATLVRLIDSKRLVGLFVVGLGERLWDAVDEAARPETCEWREVHNAAVIWPYGKAPGIPEPIEDDQPEAVRTDAWIRLEVEDGRRWHRIPNPATEGKAR